jgi:hypothetical protein
MTLTKFLQKTSIGLAFLPIVIVLHLGQVAGVDGGQVCDARFDSSMNSMAC